LPLVGAWIDQAQAFHQHLPLDRTVEIEALAHRPQSPAQLTVLQIAHLDLKQAAFACLSSCESGLGGTVLPDEAIHLAAALQVAGYRQIVATLWSIGDNTAPAIARNFLRGAELLPPGAAGKRAGLADLYRAGGEAYYRGMGRQAQTATGSAGAGARHPVRRVGSAGAVPGPPGPQSISRNTRG
jgi:hypothetical protein